MRLVYLPTCTIKINNSCRWIYRSSHGSFGNYTNTGSFCSSICWSRFTKPAGGFRCHVGTCRSFPLWMHALALPCKVWEKSWLLAKPSRQFETQNTHFGNQKSWWFENAVMIAKGKLFQSIFIPPFGWEGIPDIQIFLQRRCLLRDASPRLHAVIGDDPEGLTHGGRDQLGIWSCPIWFGDESPEAKPSSDAARCILVMEISYLRGGNSNIFMFIPNPGEMIQFDEHSFQMGWNHQLEILDSNWEQRSPYYQHGIIFLAHSKDFLLINLSLKVGRWPSLLTTFRSQNPNS